MQRDACAQAGVINDLVLLLTVGIRPVLVHGGGPEINTWLAKLGIEPQFKNGLRVTDGALRSATFSRSMCMPHAGLFPDNIATCGCAWARMALVEMPWSSSADGVACSF